MFFFFCKQKTAYEMRISDWSSDVCSSDLTLVIEQLRRQLQPVAQAIAGAVIPGDAGFMHTGAGRLADDQEARAGGSAHHWARPQRQVRCAEDRKSVV